LGADWNAWTEKNKASVAEPLMGAGKTKTVGKDGVTDTRNDIMMYGIFQAESHEEMAALFVGHPHFDIPEATIEIMAITPLSEMGQ
jgi:muconolactone delta-isomerase